MHWNPDPDFCVKLWIFKKISNRQQTLSRASVSLFRRSIQILRALNVNFTKLCHFVDFHRFYPFKYTCKETQKPPKYTGIERVSFAFFDKKSNLGPPSGQPAYLRISKDPPDSIKTDYNPPRPLYGPLPPLRSQSTENSLFALFRTDFLRISKREHREHHPKLSY